MQRIGVWRAACGANHGHEALNMLVSAFLPEDIFTR
jgi:hypothetical protein